MNNLKIEEIKALKDIEARDLCGCDLASLERPVMIRITCRKCGAAIYDTEIKED